MIVGEGTYKAQYDTCCHEVFVEEEGIEQKMGDNGVFAV